LIEGAYEKRESVNIDDNKKYGVSAMLLQDENTAIGSYSKENDDDPYEKLGRCNSFTPKTRAEKTKKQIELKEKKENENSENEKGEDDKEDETQFPYVGKNNSTMPVSSFKPGASMRKKQQRTSMKKPKVENSLSSETHEEVKITPKPSKKEMKLPSPEEGNEYDKLLDDTDVEDGISKSSNDNNDNNDMDKNDKDGDGYELVADKEKIQKETNSDYERLSDVLNDERKEPEKKANYADIEIVKDDKNDKPALLENGTGNYTDVIIADD